MFVGQTKGVVDPRSGPNVTKFNIPAVATYRTKCAVFVSSLARGVRDSSVLSCGR